VISYELARRERCAIRSELGERAFGALWDENTWPTWATAVIISRMRARAAAERRQRRDRSAERRQALRSIEFAR
jgi:hypothetical protein